MKIIDLLNKIANGEKVPKIVKYDSVYYTYDKGHYTWFEDLDCVSYDLAVDGNLNDEVEIIEEEKKIPEKCKHVAITYSTLKDINYLESYVNDLTDTVNELIDYLESKEKGE